MNWEEANEKPMGLLLSNGRTVVPLIRTGAKQNGDKTTLWAYTGADNLMRLRDASVEDDVVRQGDRTGSSQTVGDLRELDQFPQTTPEDLARHARLVRELEENPYLQRWLEYEVELTS